MVPILLTPPNLSRRQSQLSAFPHLRKNPCVKNAAGGPVPDFYKFICRRGDMTGASRHFSTELTAMETRMSRSPTLPQLFHMSRIATLLAGCCLLALAGCGGGPSPAQVS